MNYLECKSRMVVEGKDIGGFTSCNISKTKELTSIASIKLPFFSIGKSKDGRQVESKKRMEIEEYQIKEGAKIVIYAQYKGMEELEIFRGYITQIVSNMPSEICCEDVTTSLKYGRISKEWNQNATIEQMVKTAIDSSKEPFKKWRANKGFSSSPWGLNYKINVDIKMKTPTWKEATPHRCLSQLIDDLHMHCNVKGETLYVGSFDGKEVVLNTEQNVVDRKLKPIDDPSKSYHVKINFVKEGKIVSVEEGDENGEVLQRPIQKIESEKEARALAQNILKMTKGEFTEGTITTLLYPPCDIYDTVKYTDKYYTEYSGDYFVTGVNLQLGSGYRQIITLTSNRYKV